MSEDILEAQRKEIDQADSQLLEALHRRMMAVKKIGEYKKQRNIPPLDLKRWQKVIDSRRNKAKEMGLNTDFVTKIWDTIHRHALELEQ